MADVTGPISTLPGASHALPPGTMCDEHPDRPAVARIQGETDSFGCEMADLCQPCLDEHRAAVREWRERPTKCDWCKNVTTDCRETRDYDEGMCGPVYDVCAACRRRRNEQAAAELEEHEADRGYGDWDDEPLGRDPDPDPEPAVNFTHLRKSTLLWQYRDHWSGERAAFQVCGLYVYVVDHDGDGSIWEIRKGKSGPVLRSGSSCGHDDFVDCAAAAEDALRAILKERIAELRKVRLTGVAHA